MEPKGERGFKTIQGKVELKDDGEPGSVSAVFSTFNVVDSDNDVVLASAFTNGQSVPMTWSHDWSKPVGKGQIVVKEDRAVFDGMFFLETDAGLEAYKTVKALSLAGLQEWSWGFRVIDAGYEQRDEKFVRVIKRAEVFEVSPVLVGAGVGTYTLGIKEGVSSADVGHSTLADQADAVQAAVVDLASRYKALAALRAKEGRVLSEANRKRLGNLLDALRAVETDIDELLTATAPEKGIDPMRLFVEFQQIQARLAGVRG